MPSYPETAKRFEIPNEDIVRQWKRRFDVHDFDGLADRRKRVLTMNKDKNKQTKDDKIKQLEKNNEYFEKVDEISTRSITKILD